MTKNDNPFDKPHRVALCRSMKYGWLSILDYADDRQYTEYVRISEPAEVRFQPLQDDAVIRNAIAACDAAEKAAYLELNQKLAQIREQKSQLLALTHQPESAS